jgi:homogentisate 1,2-dioxygenase
MRYHVAGEIPAKRHVQFRKGGTLLTEEVLGFEGFSGNESILYHLHSPCRVAEVGGSGLAFTPEDIAVSATVDARFVAS